MTMSDFERSSDLRLDSPHSQPNPGANRIGGFAWVALAIVLTGTGVALGIHQYAESRVWERFDTVKPGVLYRSGQLSTAQLRDAIDHYGIRTVVNFQVRDRTLVEEEKLVQGMGLKFVNLPMPGDGFGEESQFRQFLALMDDPENRPVLIHCAAGTCRTGAAVALYRFERDGWSIDDVSDEMKRQAYDTGWISGYVFKMLKHKPQTAFRDETTGGPLSTGFESQAREPVARKIEGETELRK